MRILVIGSGRVGSAAIAKLSEGNEVIVASRSTDPAVDVTNAESITALFAQIGDVDAVVATIGKVPFKPLAEFAGDDFAAAFNGKVLPQLEIVRIGTPFVRDGGSIADDRRARASAGRRRSRGINGEWCRRRLRHGGSDRAAPRHSHQRRESDGARIGHASACGLPGAHSGERRGCRHGVCALGGRC